MCFLKLALLVLIILRKQHVPNLPTLLHAHHKLVFGPNADSNDAGVLNSMTPRPAENNVFDPQHPGLRSLEALSRGQLGPLAESTPLEEKEGKAAAVPAATAVDGDADTASADTDVDATPRPSMSGQSQEAATPTPPVPPNSLGSTADASPPFKVPVRNLQSLLREKSELHPYFKVWSILFWAALLFSVGFQRQLLGLGRTDRYIGVEADGVALHFVWCSDGSAVLNPLLWFGEN